MLVKSEGIILHRFKYAESSVICKIFTQEYGLQSFIFQGVSSNKGKIKAAHLTPLNIVELNFYHHPVKNLKRVKELNCSPILHSIHIEPRKRALAGFLQEIISRCISEEEINQDLFFLIKDTIQQIEHADKVQEWLPHLFIIRLCRILGHGIYADNYNEGDYFDLIEGDFTNEAYPKNSMGKPASQQLALLLSERQAENTFRKELLQELIKFLQYHVIGNKPLQSLDIFSVVGS